MADYNLAKHCGTLRLPARDGRGPASICEIWDDVPVNNTNPFPSITAAKNGIVATTHPLAAEIGISILQAGGNAVDAAMQPQGHVQILVNLIDFGMDVFQAGAAPRIEHLGSATPTGLPADGSGTVVAEAAIPPGVIDELRARGHHISYGPPNSGSYQGILLDPATGQLLGASEPRRDGRALGY